MNVGDKPEEWTTVTVNFDEPETTSLKEFVERCERKASLDIDRVRWVEEFLDAFRD